MSEVISLDTNMVKGAVHNIAGARAHLPELVERASAGEIIIVTRAGKPRARLVSLDTTGANLRVPGKGKGRFVVAHDFDAALPADVLADFESGGSWRCCSIPTRFPAESSGASPRAGRRE